MTAAYPARLACDDSASIFCARVVRGTISIETELTDQSRLLEGIQKAHVHGATLQRRDLSRSRVAHAQNDVGVSHDLDAVWLDLSPGSNVKVVGKPRAMTDARLNADVESQSDQFLGVRGYQCNS